MILVVLLLKFNNKFIDLAQTQSYFIFIVYTIFYTIIFEFWRLAF